MSYLSKFKSNRRRSAAGTVCAIVSPINCQTIINEQFIRRALCCKKSGVRQGGPEEEDILNFICFDCYNAPSSKGLKCQICFDEQENLQTSISPDHKKSRKLSSVKDIQKLTDEIKKKLLISPYRKKSLGNTSLKNQFLSSPPSKHVQLSENGRSLLQPSPLRNGILEEISETEEEPRIAPQTYSEEYLKMPLATFTCSCCLGELKCITNKSVRRLMTKAKVNKTKDEVKVLKSTVLKGLKATFRKCCNNKVIELECNNNISNDCFKHILELHSLGQKELNPEKCYDCTSLIEDTFEDSDNKVFIVDKTDSDILSSEIKLTDGGIIADNMSSYFGKNKRKQFADDSVKTNNSVIWNTSGNCEEKVDGIQTNSSSVIADDIPSSCEEKYIINDEMDIEELQNNLPGADLAIVANEDMEVFEEEMLIENSDDGGVNINFESPSKAEALSPTKNKICGREPNYHLLRCYCPEDDANLCCFEDYKAEMLFTHGIVVKIIDQRFYCKNRKKGCRSIFFGPCVGRFDNRDEVECDLCTIDSQFENVPMRGKIEPVEFFPHKFSLDRDGVEYVEKSPKKHTMIDLTLSPIEMAQTDSQSSSYILDISSSSSKDQLSTSTSVLRDHKEKHSISFQCDVVDCQNDFMEEHCPGCFKEFKEKFYYCFEHQVHNKVHLTNIVVNCRSSEQVGLSSSPVDKTNDIVNDATTSFEKSSIGISETYDNKPKRQCHLDDCYMNAIESFCSQCRSAVSVGVKLYFCQDHSSHGLHLRYMKEYNVDNTEREESKICVTCGHDFSNDFGFTLSSKSDDFGYYHKNEDFSLCNKCFNDQSQIGLHASESDNLIDDNNSDAGEDIENLLDDVDAKFVGESDFKVIEKENKDENNDTESVPELIDDNNDYDNNRQGLFGLKLNKSLHLAGGRVYDEEKPSTIEPPPNSSNDYDFSNAHPLSEETTTKVVDAKEFIRLQLLLKDKIKWSLGKHDINIVKSFTGEDRAFARHVFNLANSMAPSDKSSPYYDEINVDKNDPIYQMSFFYKYNWVPMGGCYRRGKNNFGDGLPYISMCFLYHPIHGYRYVLVAIDCSTCRRPITGYTIFDYNKINSAGFDGFYLVRTDNNTDLASFNEFIGCDPLKEFDQKAVATRYYHFCVNSKLVYDPRRGIQLCSRFYESSNLNRHLVPKSEQFDPNIESDPSFELWGSPLEGGDNSHDWKTSLVSTRSYSRSDRMRTSSRIEKDNFYKKQLEEKQREELAIILREEEEKKLQAMREKIERERQIQLDKKLSDEKRKQDLMTRKKLEKEIIAKGKKDAERKQAEEKRKTKAKNIAIAAALSANTRMSKRITVSESKSKSASKKVIINEQQNQISLHNESLETAVGAYDNEMVIDDDDKTIIEEFSGTNKVKLSKNQRRKENSKIKNKLNNADKYIDEDASIIPCAGTTAIVQMSLNSANKSNIPDNNNSRRSSRSSNRSTSATSSVNNSSFSSSQSERVDFEANGNVTTSSSILRDENLRSSVFDRIEAQFRNQSMLLAKEREDIENSNNTTKELISLSNKRSKKLEKKLDKYFAESEQKHSNILSSTMPNNVGISQPLGIQPPTSTVPINMYTPNHQQNITGNSQLPQFQQQYNPVQGIPYPLSQPVHTDFNNQQLPYHYNLTTNHITNVPGVPQMTNHNMIPYTNQLSSNNFSVPYNQLIANPNPASFIMAPPAQTTAPYYNNIPQQYYQHPQQSPLMLAVNPQQQQHPMMVQPANVVPQQAVAAQQYNQPVTMGGITYYPYNQQQHR